MKPLFASVSFEGSPIQFATEALRTHPRRSERVLEVCSPLVLKLVRYLVPYPYILWTTLSSWVCKGLPQRPGGLPVLISQSALRLSITTSHWVSSSQRSRKSSSSSGWSSPILSRHPSTQPSTYCG